MMCVAAINYSPFDEFCSSFSFSCCHATLKWFFTSKTKKENNLKNMQNYPSNFKLLEIGLKIGVCYQTSGNMVEERQQKIQSVCGQQTC